MAGWMQNVHPAYFFHKIWDNASMSKNALQTSLLIGL